MNKKTVRDVFDARLSGIEITDNQKNRILQKIYPEEAKVAPVRYARRLSFASVMAMALMVAMLAVAIAAGTRYGVFDFMGRIFGKTDVLPQATELVQTNLGILDLPNTIITAEEAVYDGGSLQVVYSIEAKNLSRKPAKTDLENPAPGQNNLDGELTQALAADMIYDDSGLDWFLINGERYSTTNGSFSDVLLDKESGKIYCYVNLQLASSGIIPQGDFTVSLPVAGEPQDAKLLAFTMKETASQGSVPTLQTAQETVTVKSAFVTPIRVYVNLRVEVKEGVPPEKAQYLLEDWRDAILVDASGNELGSPLEMYPGNIEDGKASDYHYTFLPVDLAEVYLAPTTIDKDGNWVVDMNRSLQVK